MNLDEIRGEIDTIDSELVELFCKRMELCEKVADYKIKNDMPVYHPQREKQILEKLSSKAHKGMESAVERLYVSIMDISKNLQSGIINKANVLDIPKGVKNITDNCDVACQGVECAFSHIAALKAFNSPNISFFSTFEQVFKAVESGLCSYGVVPIENTSAGSVTDNYDLMLKYGLYIVKSVNVEVNHCLLGTSDSAVEDMQEIYSHPQALSQCSEFFEKHKKFKANTYSNTAAAAAQIALLGDKTKGAIGSKSCAKRYGLKVLRENIQNKEENITRFVVVSSEPISNENCNRISMVMRLKHQPASLYRALSAFAVRGINLLKLESRPIPESPFEFMFYCDFNGNISNENVQNALIRASEESIFIEYMGNYPNEQ